MPENNKVDRITLNMVAGPEIVFYDRHLNTV